MSHFYDIIFWQYVFLCLLFSAEVIRSHSSSCRTTQCMFTLIFCVGTWLFWPVNYYCRMLFDSKQFPEIKTNVVPKLFFLDVVQQVAVTHSWRDQRRRCIPLRLKTIHWSRYFSSKHYLLRWFSLHTKKWYHFHSDEVRRRVAQHCHLPIDDYANSYTVHWCNKRKKKREERTVIRASGVSTTTGERLWVSLESGFCESAQPNELLHHMAALWAAPRRQHLLSQLVFTLSIFRANGPSQGWSLTGNSPLM